LAPTILFFLLRGGEESRGNEPEYSAQSSVVQRVVRISSIPLDPLELRQILPKQQVQSAKIKHKQQKARDISYLGFELPRKVYCGEENSLAQIMAETIEDFPPRFRPRVY
jgi:hypothetical protein